MPDLPDIQVNGVRLAYEVAALVVMDARVEADSPERRARHNVMIARVLDSGSKALTDELVPTLLAVIAPDEMKKQLRETTGHVEHEEGRDCWSCSGYLG